MQRRSLLKAGIAPLAVPASVLGLRGATPPSDRITLAHIGTGGMGTGHVRAFLQNPRVRTVAICDVRRQNRDNAARLVNEAYGAKDCATYNDYRELLARPDIDGIVLAVPDHWHALIGIEAARRRKHVYYEKPLSMSVAESQAVREAVKRYGIVFQFGTQQRSDEGYRFACELVRNGRLGKLQNIFIGTATGDTNIPLRQEPVPDGLDYEMWLGPAPWAPYQTERCTRNFTLIRDYSLGCLSGAWGIHDVDIAQWALDADATGPVAVEATGEFPRDGLYDTARAFDAVLTYANGVNLHLMDMRTALKKRQQFRLQWMCMMFEGSGGWVLVGRNGLAANPPSLLREIIRPGEIRLPRGGGHMGHRAAFVEAIRTGAPTISPIEAAVRSDTVCHLADIGMRLGRKLRWNPEAEKFVGDDTANRLLSRTMRSPWTI
jgi:predicted dehydrogenase